MYICMCVCVCTYMYDSREIRNGGGGGMDKAEMRGLKFVHAFILAIEMDCRSILWHGCPTLSPLVLLNKLSSSSSSSSPSPPPPPPPPPPPTTHNKCTPPLPSAGHLAGTGEEGQLLDNLRRRESRRSISTTKDEMGIPLPPRRNPLMRPSRCWTPL